MSLRAAAQNALPVEVHANHHKVLLTSLERKKSKPRVVNFLVYSDFCFQKSAVDCCRDLPKILFLT
jgi:hypothetical protein